MLNRANQWCALQDIVQSVLADAIRADAMFQLRQAEAWQQMGESLRQSFNHPSLDMIDLSAGLGRLENLAIGELNVQLGLEFYCPNRLQRMLRRMGRYLGLCDSPQVGFCRLSNAKNRQQLEIKLTRNEAGQWVATTSPEKIEASTS